MMNKKSICLTISLLALAAIPLWLFFISPELKKIPDNFYYSADILSLDNFYDEKVQGYEGQQISKTRFSYSVKQVTPDYLVIENQFAVRKLNDAPIFSVTRIYYIDPYTEQHVPVNGQEQRTGFLFGPPNADKQNYSYWHVNYDTPAPLKFVSSEKIDGLTVYHYRSHYYADQSKNLTYLPGVPKTRGVKTDITLDVWIEPVTGWLVKYQDNTLASYYDRETGKLLNPWNHFANQYTINSIHTQVKNAYYLKIKTLFIDEGIPLILLAVAIIFACLAYTTRDLNKYLHVSLEYIYIFISLSVIVAGALALATGMSKNHPQILTIGIASWNKQANFIETENGFIKGLTDNMPKSKNKIKFVIKYANSDIETQINNIQDFLKEPINLLFTLSTAGTLVAKGIATNIPIVFANVTYPVETEIIQSLNSSNNNLTGMRNYIPAEQQFYYFDRLFPNTKVLGFVHRRGSPVTDIQYAEFKDTLALRGISVVDIAAIDLNDLRQQLGKLSPSINALYLACDTLTFNGAGDIIADYTRQHKMPSFSCDKRSAAKGILVSYLINPYIEGYLSGMKAALILQGADPRWLHVESPASRYLMINKQTAALLGITIPEDLKKEAHEY